MYCKRGPWWVNFCVPLRPSSVDSRLQGLNVCFMSIGVLHWHTRIKSRSHMVRLLLVDGLVMQYKCVNIGIEVDGINSGSIRKLQIYNSLHGHSITFSTSMKSTSRNSQKEKLSHIFIRWCLSCYTLDTFIPSQKPPPARSSRPLPLLHPIRNSTRRCFHAYERVVHGVDVSRYHHLLLRKLFHLIS